MRLLFSLLVLLCSLNSVAQHKKTKDTSAQLPQMDIEKLKRQIDSSNKMMETLNNSMYKKIENDAMDRSMEQNANNLNAFMAERKEEERRQVKQMWIRLGLGVFILGFGIFAMLRRRKKSKP